MGDTIPGKEIANMNRYEQLHVKVVEQHNRMVACREAYTEADNNEDVMTALAYRAEYREAMFEYQRLAELDHVNLYTLSWTLFHALLNGRG